MADITDQHDQTSPTDLDESHSVGNGNAAGETRGIKRQRPSAADDDDDDDEKGGRERRKIEIKFISDKSRRHITFSKRKAGIMKKAYELSVLTGTQVLLLVVSETGLVYTFTTPKLQPLVTKAEGKNLIQVRKTDGPLPHAFASHCIRWPFAFWLARCFVFRPDPLCGFRVNSASWVGHGQDAVCDGSPVDGA
ncbi:transcription factor of the MADS box [Purpureocillium takamizusanense]|uniref:Transcription factor of the MADS box n=1 Tax=Purpureocillium takamizusanense TaxID=2060973 RepID=A0A9Q8QR68_9HYPO|nr:transcription factor of the MADS box [Purpureocillium takamizusanense]UNI24188.1 transcription factor of the MADS box [Purpureocillium takamizusanense]